MTRPDFNATRRFCGLLVLATFCSLTTTNLTHGQFAPIPTPEERAKMYDTLAEDVAHLEQTVAVLKKVVHLVKPTVVHIEAAKPDELSGRVRNSIEEAGSGTLIEFKDKFYVITNRHVIEGAETRNIRLKLADGRILNPTKIWGDPGTDIAVMAIKADHLIPARIGNSDKLDIGDFVLAVGSPFAQSHSFTFGIVSAKGRRGLELGKGVDYQDFIQTDAAINPGNSGGPLINLRGELVGMNTAIASNSGGSEGIGFSIPVNIVMSVAKQLIERGTVARAYLGVTLARTFSQLEAAKLGLSRAVGARVAGITQNSPAQLANLQVDDVILEINGVAIDDDSHLISLIGLTEVGRELPIVVFRNKQAIRMSVKVGDKSKFEK